MKYVLYHSNCYDGFGAAFAAWKKLGSENVTYIPVSYGYPPPKMEDVSEIYILDFSYDYNILDELQRKYSCSILVLDHHKTAEEKLTNIENPNAWIKVEFDMNRSGAKMAWEHFHSESTGGVPYNQLIEHISDRDLWRFEMEGTREIHKALLSYPMEFTLWDTFNDRISELISEGRTLDRMHKRLVSNICKNPFNVELGGHSVPAVNTSIAWSEVGHQLVENHPKAPFVASFTVFENQIMWSLRSKGEFDVSEIAKQYGGGGHRNAAGFKTVRF